MTTALPRVHTSSDRRVDIFVAVVAVLASISTAFVVREELDVDHSAVNWWAVGIFAALLIVAETRPDFALLHASRADPEGNVQLFGTCSTFEEQARAAKRVIVTVEEIVPDCVIRERPEFTLIPGFLVEAVVLAPFGAHPAGMFRYYDFDRAHVGQYVQAGKSRETFRRYLEEYVLGVPDHNAYLAKIGIRTLMAMRADPYWGY